MEQEVFQVQKGKPFLISDNPKFNGGDCKWLKVGTVVEVVGKKVKGRSQDIFNNPITYVGIIHYNGERWLCFKVSKYDSPTLTANTYLLYNFSEELDELYQKDYESGELKIYKASFKKII